MKIQVLGPGCVKCNKLYADVEQALSRAGVSAELSKVHQLDQIASLGVVFTPGLLIDGEVKCQGRVPRQKQILAWITEAAGK